MSGRILVTGATGFIGTHLCDRLVADGYDVTALRRASSDPGALQDSPVDWATADVLDATALATAVDGHDAVVHLAGVGLSAADADTVMRVNDEGTANVLAAADEAGIDRLVFASTAGTRRSEGVADETDVASPVGAYQRSKRRAERRLDEYAAAGGDVDVVTVHPTSVFGSGDESFTARLLRLVAGRSPVHPPGGASFVGIDDVVDGTVAALERGEAGEHYLLAGENLTYREALGVIARHADGSRPPVRLPATAIHLAGPVVGAVNDVLGTRLFPFDAAMARLVTDENFYAATKAARELDYEYAPLAAHVPDALEWHADR